MYPQLLKFSKLFTMQNETTDYCCQNFFENQSLTCHHVPTWYNGERHYAVVYQKHNGYVNLIGVLRFHSDKTCTKLFLSITLHFSNSWIKTVHPVTFFET